jgi:hypothetical protein
MRKYRKRGCGFEKHAWICFVESAAHIAGMVNRRRALLVVAALVGAAWINAAQERRSCGACSPTVAALDAMTSEWKIPAH